MVLSIYSINGWRFDQILIGRTVIRDSGYMVMVVAIISGILVFLMFGMILIFYVTKYMEWMRGL